MSEQPTRRYQRSFNGLIGAMIVTVLFVLAFVGWIQALLGRNANASAGVQVG